MTKLARWTLAAALAALATAAPARASFLQEVGSPFTVGVNPYGAVAADFNRDGRPDLATINGTSSNLSVLLRQPAGGFAAEAGSPFTVASGPNYGAVADYNGDGWPDIAVAAYQGGAVSILIRKPTGGFTAEAAVTAAGAGAVAAGDFNADGRPDLAVARYNNASIQIFLRNAANTGFTAGSTYATGANPRFIAAADFSGDGRPDLAVSNIGGASVTILIGTGGGAFVQEIGSPVGVGTSPVGLVATDLTGDGRPDLAVANSGSNTVSLFTRVPAGGFTSGGAPIPVGTEPYGVETADFNRDGRVDLAVANHKSGTVSILLRQADGSFTADTGSPIPTGVGADQIAIADFNGDSRPDLAVTNDGASSVTVLLNTTPEPVVVAPPVDPPVVNPAPVAPVTPVVPAPRISARLALAWTVFRNYVVLDSATVKDIPAGATVKVTCGTCKRKSLTLTAKKTTLTLSKLRGAKLKRGKTFTVTITKPGYVGLSMTRKVKNYGRTLKALKKAVKAPFSETRGCVPVGATKPAKTC